MNLQWQEFLAARAAPGSEAAHPADDDPSARCTVCDLSHLGLIRVTGEDAMTFLQGQLTNDIRRVTETHTQLSGHCSPKGRLLAIFHVMRMGDAVYLQLPRELVPGILARLRMFVLRSRVEVTDVSDDLIRLGAAGIRAADILSSGGLAVPAQPNEMATTNGVMVVRLPGAIPRFQITGGFDAVARLWSVFAPEATLAAADVWALHDIRAGIPTVCATTADAFVPQMVNMQLIDGVSFTKGCYTGQEVVARMQYLGKLKRRMYYAAVDASTPPRPGDELHSALSTSEQASGRVVDARAASPGRYELLAVVEKEVAAAGDARLGEDGPVLRFSDPPYGFPAET